MHRRRMKAMGKARLEIQPESLNTRSSKGQSNETTNVY